MQPLLAEDNGACFLQGATHAGKRTKFLQAVEGPESQRSGSPYDGIPQNVWRADGDKPARLDDTGHLPQCLIRIWRMFYAFRGNDDIKTVEAKVVRQRQRVNAEALATDPLFDTP